SWPDFPDSLCRQHSYAHLGRFQLSSVGIRIRQYAMAIAEVDVLEPRPRAIRPELQRPACLIRRATDAEQLEIEWPVEIGVRHRIEQSPRIRMHGLTEQHMTRRNFDESAARHH